MKINDFLTRMWNDYSDLNPHINKVLDLIKEKESKTIINDHIALRTFNHKKINRHVLSSYFVKNGYKPIEDLTFTRYSLNSLKHNFISRLSLKYSKKLIHNIVFRYSKRSDLTNYRIVDTNISYKPFSNNAEFYLNLNNIFDQYYWETNLVPMPGKNFIIGYRSSF